MLAARALAERDEAKRLAEAEQESVLHMLVERGYRNREVRIDRALVDDRTLAPLDPIKSKLSLSASFTEHRDHYAKKGSSRSDYLRSAAAVPRPSSGSKSKSNVLEPRELKRKKHEEMHERLKLLIHDLHVERAGHVWQSSRSMNTLGVFPPHINTFRATTLCHSEALMRPTTSLQHLRRTAEEQLATGYERPPPKTDVSGAPIILTTGEVLKGRLDRLENNIQRKHLGTATGTRRSLTSGTARRLTVSQPGSQRLSTAECSTRELSSRREEPSSTSYRDETPAGMRTRTAPAGTPGAAAAPPASERAVTATQFTAAPAPAPARMRSSQSVPALKGGRSSG